MRNAKKALLLALCALLLVGASIMGTLAYLTSQATVTNTFTAGNVAITMVESVVNEYGVKLTGTTDKNTYKLIPNHTYVKDPTITVGENSEDCFVFVKISNGLGTAGAIRMNAGWACVATNGNESVWVYGTAEQATVLSKNGTVIPFEQFTFSKDAKPADYQGASIVVTAYAIQADTLENKTPAEIWQLFDVD